MEFEFSDLNKADLTKFREFTFQLVQGVPPGRVDARELDRG